MTIRKTASYWLSLCGMFAMVFYLAGCAGTSYDPAMPPGGFTGTNLYSPAFVVGDVVSVEFSGFDAAPPLHSEKIKEDGTINLPEVGSVQAAGKTPVELQKELTELYKRFYRNLTVTVHDVDRSYTVGGEVRSTGEQKWSTGTDLIKAIQASGGFTEFANRKKIRLIRNGKTEIVNYVKAVEDPEHYVVLIYPKDQIIVPRSIW
jgi:protein involved in polysaccharide export with SLBB domain